MAILIESLQDIRPIPLSQGKFVNWIKTLRYKGYNIYRGINVNDLTNAKVLNETRIEIIQTRIKTTSLITIYTLYPLYYYVVVIVDVLGLFRWMFNRTDSIELKVAHA